MTKKTLSPSEFAEHVGVSRARISQLKNKLKTKQVGVHWLIYVTPENLDLFSNPAHNSKRIKKIA